MMNPDACRQGSVSAVPSRGNPLVVSTVSLSRSVSGVGGRIERRPTVRPGWPSPFSP